MRRVQGRVTRDDVRSAGLRRWDGRERITTDWINLFHEPELCWPTGDCLVYLREPGQSSRGPAFKVHTSFLRAKGFESLLDRCVLRNAVCVGAQCPLPNCSGCDPQEPVKELYIPAPPGSGLEDTFQYHITTRNFFAWLYNRPLAGRTLGTALTGLKARLDLYRPENSPQNQLEVLSYAEFQRYLDFRECVDHALAALSVAEKLKVEDLWVDAFAHCVGMSHRGLRSSIEYAELSAKSKTLVNRARLEMDVRLDRVNKSMISFFENDVSGTFLGLPQPARDHLEQLRGHLKSFYTEKYGSWPPENIEDEVVQQDIYTTMLSDFQNLYQHLVDPESSVDIMENDVSKTGGMCVWQNVQAFDKKHKFEPLAQPLPRLPVSSDPSLDGSKTQRRLSWNYKQKRKALEESQKKHDKEALISASNHNALVMASSLVQTYVDFEQTTADDPVEGLSIIEGRKVRWILVYAILQTFHSISLPPKEVRNSTNLTYSLCCQPPERKPWQEHQDPASHAIDRTLSQLSPDNGYSHTNLSSASLGEALKRSNPSKTRRSTLPSTLPTDLKTVLSKTPPGSRAASLRRLVSRRGRTVDDMPSRRASFCEIYIEGYGNGLNEVAHDVPPQISAELTAEPETLDSTIMEDPQEVHELPGDTMHESFTTDIEDSALAPSSRSSGTAPPSMSRDSSTMSTSEYSSHDGDDDDADAESTLSRRKGILTLVEILRSTAVPQSAGSVKISTSGSVPTPKTHSIVAQGPAPDVKIVDVDDQHDVDFEPPYIHFNTLTWDKMLEQEPLRVHTPVGVAA